MTPTDLPVIYVNQEATLAFSAQGGTPPYVYSYSGAIPYSMSLSSQGVLSGTPFFAGNYPIIVTATDANGNAGSLIYNLLVDGNLKLSPMQLTSATVNTSYNQLIEAGAGNAPYTYIISSKNALPPNLTLNAATGEISGIPQQPGTYLFSISAYDDNGALVTKNYSLQVNGDLTIYPNNLPNGTINTAYSQLLQTGGGSPPYSYSLYSGSLPYGLQISSTGTISGTPTTDGTYHFVIDVIDSLKNHATQSYTIGITGALRLLPNSPLTNGTLNTNYNVQLAASGGVPPYTYEITSGKLPPGLSLNKSTGLISGIPSDIDVYNFSITAKDTNGNKGSQTYQLSITGNLSLTPTPPLPNAILGTSYSEIIRVNGTNNPCLFKIISSNGLPKGCTLNTASNGLSTTINCPSGPTYVGSYPFTLKAIDSINSESAVQSYTLNVNGALTMTPSNLPSGAIETPYTLGGNPVVLTVHGTSSATFSVTGEGQYLPPGLSLIADPDHLNQAIIQGTPTTTGTYPFSITATYSSGGNTYTVTNNYSISIGGTLSINPPSSTLPSASLQTSYSQTFLASDGYAPYTYAQSGGQFPPGLSLSSQGVLSGIPTATGTFTFNILATDINGNTVIGDYSLSVNKVLTITPTTLVSGIAGAAYNQVFLASNGTAPYHFVISQGNLPPGLTLSNSGTLSGTPTLGGTYTFTIDVTDNAGNIGSQSYTLNVSSSLMAISFFPQNYQILCPIKPDGSLDVCSNISNNAGAALGFTVTQNLGFYLLNNYPQTPILNYCSYNATSLNMNCSRLTNSPNIIQYNSSLVINNNYLYFSREYTPDDNTYYQLSFCPVPSNGANLSNCTNTGPQFAGPIIVTFYNNYAYILSNDGSSTINQCAVNAGVVSSICQTSPILTSISNPPGMQITNNTLYIISGNQLSTCPISASTGAVGTCSVSNVVGSWSQILAFNNVIYLASNGSSSYINYCDTSLTSCQPTGPNISLYDLGGMLGL